jgi:hypothetical protein
MSSSIIHIAKYQPAQVFPEVVDSSQIPDCLRGLDERKYNAKNITYLVWLLQVDPERFPFTEKEEEVLAIADRTEGLVNREYGMNYTRFFIGAVCGIVAVMLLSSRLFKVSPSLVNGIGATVSGSLGLLVTRVRGLNLALHSKNRASVVSELFEKHRKVAYTLLKMHFNDKKIAIDVGAQLKDRVEKILELESLHGLKREDVAKMFSPIQESLAYIFEGKAPSYPELDCLIQTNTF